MMQKNISSDSIATEAKCFTTDEANEKNENISREMCSTQPTNEALTSANIFLSESPACEKSSIKMDSVSVSESSKSDFSAISQLSRENTGESTQIREERKAKTPNTPQVISRISGVEISQRRQQSGTILWEPMLIPSETDGRVEMVTALKRVDSDYICNPRRNTKKCSAPSVKVTVPPSSQKGKPQQVIAYSKGTLPKEASDTETKHSSLKEKVTLKRKAPEMNINEQMGRAIAEKEAAILKEIEKAMKEATSIRGKSLHRETNVSLRKSLSGENTKAKITTKRFPIQNIKMKNVEEEHNSALGETKMSKGASDVSERSEIAHEIRLQDGTKLLQTLSSKEVHGTNRIVSVPGTVYTTAPSTNEIHSVGKILTVPTKPVKSPPFVGGTISKDAHAVNRMLTVPGKMMTSPTSSTGMSVSQEVSLNTVLCGPATMLATPGSSVVTNVAKETLALNKLIAVPVNTQPTSDTSPTSVQRILLLAAPTGTLSGGIPFMTPIIPTSSVPVTQASLGLPAKVSKGNVLEKRESKRIVANRGKNIKDGSDISEHNVQMSGRKSIDIEELAENNIVKEDSKKESASPHKKTKAPQDLTNNIEVPLLQNIQLPIDTKRPVRVYTKQFPSQVSPKEVPNINRSESGEKGTSIPMLEKLNDSENGNIVCNISKNSKVTYKKQENLTQTADHSKKVECNGGSMDVDEESISEELDPGSGDDLKSIGDQNVVVTMGETKPRSQRNKCHVKERVSEKNSPRKTASSTFADTSSADVALENRLQRIEQLYSEIPPVKSRISLTEDDYSRIRDGFRDSLRVVKAVTLSFKSLIGQSPSPRGKEYVNSSCQTEALRENNFADTEPNSVVDANKHNVNTFSRNKPGEEGSDLVLCRLCGEHFQKISLIALFSKLSKRKKLLSMLTTILPQSPPVQESDGLPQQVCVACVDKLTLCHNIIKQFTDADKELRQVLKEDKPMANSTSVRKNDVVSIQENKNSSEIHMDIPSPEIDTVHPKPRKSTNCKSTNESRLKIENAKVDNQTNMQRHGEKRIHAVLDSERLPAESVPPDHKHKRRRSKSPKRSEFVRKDCSAAPVSSSGCIDLSRLDPEFNDGFEVEWCLDEETIRSSMVPEEEAGSLFNENAGAADMCVSSERGIGTDKKVSTAPVARGYVEIPADTLELLPTEGSVTKANDCLGNEMPKLVDEVSNLSEMHTSVCESTAKSGSKHRHVSAVLEEKQDLVFHDASLSQEAHTCSSRPLSFPRTQEAFSHKVMQHEEEFTNCLESQEGKEDNSSAVLSEDLSQKQTSPQASKCRSERNQETVMCDQCGLPFPNEYSLCIHKCVFHEIGADTQPVVKDSTESGTKVVNFQESIEENQACKELLDALLNDGKMLVKCGRSGMLWVSCSKLFPDLPSGTAQSLDQSGVPSASTESDTVSIVSSQQNISSVSPQSLDKVQFMFKCDCCKQSFLSRADLQSHMQTHVTNEYSCSECGAKFSTMDTLNNHVPSHIPRDRVCDDCGLILPDGKKLLQHRKEHSHNLPYVCETCGKRFPNEQTLEVHEPMHYNRRGPLACSLCRKCFFFKHTLVRHRSQHASNRLQKCSLCFRVLNTSYQLRKHVALHHLMKNFVCFCKQTFPSQKELVEHRYLKHTYAEIFCARYKVEIVEPLPLHQCNICYRVLNSKQSLLKHHVTSHSSTWPFYCIQCSRKYTSMLHLARHECHRNNTLTYQCRICGKAFRNKDIFRQHKVIHDHEKWKYICRYCGKAFQKSQSLVCHIMMHGGKKFSCPRCHLQCCEKEGLLKHYNTGSCQMRAKTVQ